MKTREEMSDPGWHLEYLWQHKFAPYLKGYDKEKLATALENLARKVRAEK